MRRFMITAAFMLMATVAMSGESPDTPETRKLAAEKYIQVTDFAALWDSGLRAVAEMQAEAAAAKPATSGT